MSKAKWAHQVKEYSRWWLATMAGLIILAIIYLSIKYW